MRIKFDQIVSKLHFKNTTGFNLTKMTVCGNLSHVVSIHIHIYSFEFCNYCNNNIMGAVVSWLNFINKLYMMSNIKLIQ